MESVVGFEWPIEIVELSESIEAHGGERVCNLIRGVGNSDTKDVQCGWDKINIPFPSKSTRHRRKPSPVKENGIITDNLVNFMHLASAANHLIDNPALQLTPVILSRDAMAIKPSGDLDLSSDTLIGFKTPVDINFVKENPYSEPKFIKENLYTEAGAIIAMTADKTASLHIANDFLLPKTTGEDVYQTVTDTVKVAQACLSCISSIQDDTISQDQVNCSCSCKDCEDGDSVCEQCDGKYDHPYSQLRPCARCLSNGLQCQKLIVIGISMDCESNNSAAMKRLDSDQTGDIKFTRSFPDAVHAGKKLYRASANWWLLLDGYRVNNSIIRCLRQFDDSVCHQLRVAVSDSSLRNRDRMDFGAIIECTNPKVASCIQSSRCAPSVTMTLFPDPFWKTKTSGTITTAQDMCLGIYCYLFI